MTQKKNKKAKDVVAEASEKPSSAEKKTPKSLKPGRKIKKKSSSKSVSEAKVVTGAVPIQGIKDKQNKKIESNGIEGTNKAEGHEDEKPKINGETKEKILEKVSGKDQPGNNNDECHELEKNLDQKKKEKLGGLIFMCSAKTKPDCFHYCVMGVSASKKDLVLSVKPGLKLFLYDFDLKLMYGIYKASSSGGMKLEPEAFNGAFPVQVRFTVHVDCYPLPESIFKKAIKDNYDRTNKFRTELTVEQVKQLTKLFRPSEIHSKEPYLDSPPRARAREHDRDVYRGKGESRPHSRSTRGDHNSSGDAKSLSRLSHERYRPHREIVGSDRFPNNAFMGEKEYRTYGLQGGSIRGDARNYTVLSQHRPSSPRVEEFPPDSFMSEKEYRTYGLRRATRNTSPPAHEQERLVWHQAPIYLDVAGGEDRVGRDPLLVNELGYRAKGLHARQGLPSSILPATTNPADALVERGYHTRNPAPTHREPLHQHGGGYLTSHRSARHESLSSIPAAGTVTNASAHARDPYARTGGSYALIPDIDQARMREADTLERIYSTYASDPPSRYDQRHHYQEATKEPGRVPVSSLYSFAGPSYRP